MERRTFIIKTGTAGLIAFVSPTNFILTSKQNIVPNPEELFLNPQVSALPQTYWFWMNGNVTKEGITLDLEAMKRVGIGGVFNFDVGTGIPKGPVDYLSNDWLELKIHAIKEAHRLGLEFTMHNCPGWSSSGGPWITPELAMQQITWSETYIAGNKAVNIKLPTPTYRMDYYRDISVIAYPSLEGEDLFQTLKVSSSSGPVDIIELMDGDSKGATVHPKGANKSAWIQLEFSQTYEARLITFYISAIATEETKNKPLEFGERTSVHLEVSDDGINYRLITPINTGLETELILGDKFIVYDIPVTKAKYFRLTSTKTRRYKQVQLSGFTRLKNWMEKTNHRGRYIMFVEEPSTIQNTNNQIVPHGSLIDPSKVLDISQFLDKDGKLNWNAPLGNWTILRIGYTPTGTQNRAAPDTGIGLECDKYNPEAITFHLNKMMEHLLPEIKALGEKRRIGLEIDSYEAGTQNWTQGFEQKFRDRWGYDLIKYLPILTGGRILGSVDITERFLWDLRRIQAELIAENYYGQFHKFCQQHGMTSYIEPYDVGPMEEIQIGSKINVNIGEFWFGISSVLPVKHPASRTSKLVASIAHLNGQKVTGAEAFTAEPDSAKWQEHPFAMKAIGDKIFTKGVNRMIIHRFAHQPHNSALPGMTMGPWGIHFDRTNTWWDQGRAWLGYLSRCQSILQHGLFVADLVYFTGEDANMYTKANAEDLTPTPPSGYDYDLISAEYLINHVKIDKHHIVLSNGMRYRILVLQNFKAVTPILLKKLRDLVKEGMIMVGAKPERSAGLKYQSDEGSFMQLVEELWGSINGRNVSENKLGKGTVYWGQSLISILQNLNLKPDFEFSSRSGDAPIIYIHKKTDDSDFYFLSNQRRSYEEVVCTFRINSKQPEVWDPATGKISTSAIYELHEGRIRMPVHLDPYGSLFIVFRSPASKKSIHAIEKDNETIISTQNFPSKPNNQYRDISNSFTISFWAKPEINVLLNPSFIMGTISEPWTEYYAIFPSSGKELYGDGHATCGITVGRNGIAVWEHATGKPVLVLAAPTGVSGWSHIGLVYENGTPSVYLNGELIKTGKRSKHIIHPAPEKVYQEQGASYYNGDMSKPVILSGALRENQIKQLAEKPPHIDTSPFIVELNASKRPSLLFKQNGNYTIRKNNGKTSMMPITNATHCFKIEGSWQVRFPAGHGAPEQIQLTELISLHKHPDESVKYFSGTATYSQKFSIPGSPSPDTRWILDLGEVEVIAEVVVNGFNFGILWKRPFSIDITKALEGGFNNLEIKVTNLWPNRLIGDEQLPDPDIFTPGAGASGMDGLTGGGIEKLPQWYLEGKCKPDNGRITFATWKHYKSNSPLLSSGLLGPVIIKQACMKFIN